MLEFPGRLIPAVALANVYDNPLVKQLLATVAELTERITVFEKRLPEPEKPNNRDLTPGIFLLMWRAGVVKLVRAMAG